MRRRSEHKPFDYLKVKETEGEKRRRIRGPREEENDLLEVRIGCQLVQDQDKQKALAVTLTRLDMRFPRI